MDDKLYKRNIYIGMVLHNFFLTLSKLKAVFFQIQLFDFLLLCYMVGISQAASGLKYLARHVKISSKILLP